MREIIVIGAARSGTKILRDTLAVAFDWGKVPYDIGYVWQSGTSSTDDSFSATDLNPRDIRYIRRFVQKYGLGRRGVVEKTVGNALRVPVVHRVFPDALYIHVVRDGQDVVESAVRQWLAPADYRYMARKARHFPARQIPTYGINYLLSSVRRGQDEGLPPVWGPRYPGIESDVRVDPVEVVCAKQWAACVSSAEAGFRAVNAQVVDVRYEEFVKFPEQVLLKVAQAVSMSPDPARLERAVQVIEPPKERRRVVVRDAQILLRMGEVMNGELSRLGYRSVGEE